MTSMLAQMEAMMASASDNERQAMHGPMMEMVQGVMAMAGEMMGQMEAMPADERQTHMLQMMKVMQSVIGVMEGSLASGNAMIDHTMPMTGAMPMDGDMSMAGMDMDKMMSMMGDMQGMMAQMQDMMEGMHGSMSMDDMEEMMVHMDKMTAAMENMQGMMGDAGIGDGADTAPAQPDTWAPSPTAGHDAHGSTQSSAETEEAEEAGRGAHGGPIPSAGVPDAIQSVGGQPLAYPEEDGVKVFELTARPVRWTILEGDEPVVVTAWSYNGTVPGPLIRVTEGDQVRIVFKNELPAATSIHWHGIPLPNAMDGVPPFTQEPIQPGETFIYEFTAPPAGTFMYHSHVDTDVQIMAGLYAPLVVDPAEPQTGTPDVDVMWMLSEWRVGPDGETYPAMPMAGGEPNYFTLNGKAYPDTEPIVVKKGETVRIRLAGIGQFTHPMHLHGMNFRITGYDGVPLPPAQQITRNTLPVNPGEIIDIEFSADNVGTWLFHCHVLHHVTNDGVEPGGLIGIVQVVE